MYTPTRPHRAAKYLAEWNETFNQQVPMQVLLASKTPQHMLPTTAYITTFEKFFSKALPREKVTMKSMQTPHCSSRLNITPTQNQIMKPAAYRMALKYKTGHHIFPNSSQCSLCQNNSLADMYGDHDAVFLGGGRLVRRHNRVRDILFEAAATALLGPRKEAPNILQHTGDRPADVLIPRWAGNRSLCLDVSIVSPHVNPNMTTTAAERAESMKIRKYEERCQGEGLVFEPFYTGNNWRLGKTDTASITTDRPCPG